ncbi:hypothetical protein ACFL1H_04960 [Nanoarchaeota archaeon]
MEHKCKENLEYLLWGRQDWSGTACGEEGMQPPHVRLYKCKECHNIRYRDKSSHSYESDTDMKNLKTYPYEGRLEEKELVEKVEKLEYHKALEILEEQ